MDELPLIPFDALAQQAASSGPIWGHESTDLDITLLSWPGGAEIAAHINDEVDVLLIGVAGAGDVSVGDATYRLEQGRALLIPRGAARALRCSSDRWSYLSVHRRRRGLWPTVGGTGSR
jgi:quercetin dioxygenase-like cupin family protein